MEPDIAMSKMHLVFEQSNETGVHFDVEIAIKVLRQAGYHSHAVFLAEKHMHHEWYLKIQLEDIKVKTSQMRLGSLLRSSAVHDKQAGTNSQKQES